MTAIVKRITKGTILTVAELDANVANLNSTKLETTGGTLTGLPVLANQDVDIISPVYPTTKPSLNLDFTRGQLDPRVTFARNSTAAYYDGKSVAKAEENLFKYSQGIFGSSTIGWVVQPTTVDNIATAPDGTLTATQLTTTTATNYINNNSSTNGPTAVVGLSYVMSLWVQLVSGTGTFQMYAGSPGFSGTFTATTTWQRFTYPFTPTTATTNFRIFQTLTSGDVVNIWGAQLEQRSSVTAYTPTTTAPITNYIPVLKFAPANVPRFDYDPITGKPLGLLIEEGRTNLLTYSQDFNTSTHWLLIRASKIANCIVAPDGTLTGTKLIGNTTPTSSHWISNYAPINVNAGSSYTFSVYLKAGEYNYAALFLNVSNANTFGSCARFDLTTGAVTQETSGVATANFLSSSTNVGNGWWRISITSYAMCSNVDVHPAIGVLTVATGGSGGDDSNTQNGYSGIYMWGPQFESIGSSLAIRSSTIGTGSTTTAIVLDASASAVDGAYVGNRITYSGLQEIRTITAYVGATKTATVSVATSVTLVSGNAYSIIPATMTASGFPTSYIPTPTVAVSRPADLASMTGTNFSSWFNPAEWSVYVEADCFVTGFINTPCIFSISDLVGGTSNKINIDFGNRSFNYTNGINNYILSSLASTLSLNTLTKFATSVKPSLVYGIGSGGTIKSSTAMTSMPQNIIQLRLYDNTLLNGHIKKFTYYPKALSQPELQALTS